MADGALLRIHEALRSRGFEADFSKFGQRRYSGLMDREGPGIPAWIEVPDMDFVEMPKIGVRENFILPERLLPHLGSEGEICFFARGAVVLDRYDPGGTVLLCLNRAETVLRNALRGRLDDDFADEFRAHWWQTWMLSDLPQGYVGPARAYFVAFTENERRTAVLACETPWAVKFHRGRSDLPPSTEPACVVQTDRPLSFDPSGPWPPKTLADFNRWLSHAAPSLAGKIEDAFVLTNDEMMIIAIRAPNGTYGCRICLPKQFRTEEFLTNRRSRLPNLLRRQAASIPIERVTFEEARLDYIYGRNMGLKKNLTDKRILLIGCGTIGSFLAQQLAQSGAGAGSGYLTICDPDLLRTSNLGRHLLGVPFLHGNKAEACAEFLNAQLPGLAIEAHAGDARSLPTALSRFDLVIDATGEEALSIALNQREIEGRPSMPPHLFVWLMGNGAAAQAILTGEPGKACLKCLKPALAGEPRFRTLRSPDSVEIGVNHACADPLYIPFPVSRSVSAAALACDLALDWANGDPGHRFRSLTFDRRAAFDVVSSSPAALASCPACGPT